MTERIAATYRMLEAADHFEGYSPECEHSLPVVRIEEEALSEDRVAAALLGLAATGGTVHLPPGRLEVQRTLTLPSRVTLAGVRGQTEIVFWGVRFGLMAAGSPAAAVTGIRIRDLSLRHLAAPAGCVATVFLTHAHHVELSNLEITACGGQGFLLADGVRHVRADHCNVQRASDNGWLIIRTVADVTLASCTVEQSGGSGLLLADWRLQPGLDPLNFFQQAGNSPVAFSPDDAGPCRINLLGCSLTGNRKMGLCTDGGALIRVSGCEISDNQCEGITFDNGTWGCLVEGSRIRSNGRRAHQSERELQEDFVREDGQLPDGSSQVKLPGVSLDNSAFCSVQTCLIEGNYGEGVKYVRAAHGCTVAHNLIGWNNRGYSAGHPHFGVRLGSDPRQHPGQFDFPANAIRIEHNDIVGGHTAGILLNEGAVGNIIRGNRIVGAVAGDIVNRSHGDNVIEKADCAHLF